MSEDNEKNKFEKDREKAEARKQQQAAIVAELKSNAAFMEELAQYEEADRDAFLEQYAQKKVTILEWGPNYLQWQENEDLHWVDDAAKRLAEILQKKLFDAQCLWRAEKLFIDEIITSDDFYLWEKKIFSCPFIEPVTQEEVDMYHRYLSSNNFEHNQFFLNSWQDYRSIKAAYKGEETFAWRNFPEWYDFHNGVTGNGVFLNLPDIRGEKEDYYIRLACDEEENEKPKKQSASTPSLSPSAPAKKPDIKYMKRGFLRRFVTTFDTEETREHFNGWGGDRAWDADERAEREEQANSYFTLLSTHCEIVPIKAAPDWFPALQQCVSDYSRLKIADALPLAFEEYTMFMSNFIAVPSFMDAFLFNTDICKNRILRGRRIAGEPEDFNF